MIAGMLINEGLVLPMFGVIIYPHTWLIMFVALAVGLGLLVWFRFGMRGFAVAAALGAIAACFVLVVGGPSAASTRPISRP